MTAVRTIITQRVHISNSLKSRPKASTTKRSARSMIPPLATYPRDSALARWYDTSMARLITATGSIMVWPGSVSARYQAMPPNSRVSVRRSDTESKKAPRCDEVPEALATAPSSASGIPASISSRKPTRR